MSLLPYIVRADGEYKCYKVCHIDGRTFASACISSTGWCVRYRMGEFINRGSNFVGLGGLLAFDHLVPAIIFAKTVNDKDHRVAVFEATGIGPIDTKLFRRRITVFGRVTDELSVHEWPIGTVCYEQIRLDERISWDG